MKHLFADLKTSTKLKSLGFDENCLMGYDDEYLKHPSSTRYFGPYCHQNKHIIKAPLHQQAILFLLNYIDENNGIGLGYINITLYGDISGQINNNDIESDFNNLGKLYDELFSLIDVLKKE